MGMARFFTRAIRPPPDDITPNPNDPASVPPSTVGPDQLVVPGDPHGVLVDPDPPAGPPPPRILPSAWSGWPAEWWPPLWGGQLSTLTDTAWMCIDLNASALTTMPPYLVNAAPTLSADWLRNPDSDIYSSWEEFVKSVFWDFQAVGETFVLATARYSSGWPARFHVVPPWAIEAEMDAGLRRYSIGSVDVTSDILHIRYQSSVSDAHGHGPLEAGNARVVAAQVLSQYATSLAQSGGIPPGMLVHPEELSPQQSADLQAQWVQARRSTIGEPAVLSGGLDFKTPSVNPRDMALLELSQFNESRIALLLGVPPVMVGLPSGGDPMTYSNVTMMFDLHWRAGLRPKAQIVMAALSEWLLPRGTRVELNSDAYVQPEPLQRAQTYQILAGIVDPITGLPALTVDEIRAKERFDQASPADLSSGVLK